MQIGIVGLGRMGSNIAKRLMSRGHKIVAFDHSAKAVEAISGASATGVSSLKDMVTALAAPRVFWIMLPAGKPTEETVTALGGLLSRGDAVIDGGDGHDLDIVPGKPRIG